jgi:hypothetical protein
MITLEEQLRRYATDVAGPAHGPVPPLRDGGRGPAPVGRLVLVAALVVFVAGFAWLVVRASATDHEQMVPAEPEVPAVPEPTSWAGEPGMCTDTIAGIPLEGPDGEGLCLGIDASRSEGFGVADIQDGRKTVGLVLTACETIRADWALYGFSGEVYDGRRAMHWGVSSKVDMVVAPLRSGRRLAARAFEMPGLEGIKFVSFWIDADDDIGGLLEMSRPDGSPFVPTGEQPDLPEHCRAAQPRPQVPTPSDSEEWEDQVLDHRGEVRGRTAGLVELHGVSAYRVVDDRGELVGYTMVDGGVGFIDRALAEHADTLRQLVACGDEYVATLTATPECTNALATIGIDTTPPPISEP